MALTPPIAFRRFIWDTAEILYVCHRSNHGKALKTNLQTIYERDAARLKVWFRLRYKNMHCILHRKKRRQRFFPEEFLSFSPPQSWFMRCALLWKGDWKGFLFYVSKTSAQSCLLYKELDCNVKMGKQVFVNGSTGSLKIRSHKFSMLSNSEAAKSRRPTLGQSHS